MSRLTDMMQTLPLTVSGWLYNARRIARLLTPMRRYPLADTHNVLSCQPLIIVSSGRSGTTLLRSMLVMGGEIAIPPETEILPTAMLQFTAMQELGWVNLSRLVISLQENSFNFPLWEMDLNPVYLAAKAVPPQEQSLARLIDLLYMGYADAHFPDAICWGDQTPDNFLYYHWFLSVFPQAKYLHVLRDGRDVVASLLKMKNHSLDYAVGRWQQSIHNADKISAQVPKSNYMELRYEDLVTDTASSLQRVCVFANIAYVPDMLEYWRSTTTVEHQRYTHHENLAKPVFTSSIGRWKERLSPEQQQAVQAQCAPLLQRYGYI